MQITMRQVALRSRVSVSTVSKALRDDPSIPIARCRQIQQLAAKMGYRPNPMVSVLMAQLHHHRRRSDPHSIAWIDLWHGEEEHEPVMETRGILKGARDRAGELGYQMELYRISKDFTGPRQLSRCLATRGQWGVIIPPVPAGFRNFPLDMRGLTAVTIGTSLLEPVMHRVSPNHFQGCVLAFERLQGMGFRRIGLALSPQMNKRVEGKWLGAYLSSQATAVGIVRIKPFIGASDDFRNHAEWLMKERPDAVLVAEEFDWKRACKQAAARGQIRPALGWLMSRQADRKNPGGLGRLDYRPEQLGHVAVDTVVSQIQRNERGEPADPRTILIDSVWIGN